MKGDFKIYKIRDEAKGHLILETDPHSYQDLLDMPDTINVSFGIQIYNYTSYTLYFKAQGSGSEPNWAWGGAKTLGSISPGSNKYFLLKNLGSRSKPASAVDDGIEIMVRAYTDAGYSNEVGDGYPIVITYHWIKSDDLNLLDLDNFDTDASLEGWSGFSETGTTASLTLQTDYVLSSPNSARLYQYWGNKSATKTIRGGIQKSFDIPDCTKAYFICNGKHQFSFAFSHTYGNPNVRYMSVTLVRLVVDAEEINSTRDQLLVYNWSIPAFDTTYHEGPYSNWLRHVGVLPVNQTVTAKCVVEFYGWGGYQFPVWTRYRGYTWFDDLKVVYET